MTSQLSNRQLEDPTDSPTLRRPRRVKTQSSLKGMFLPADDSTSLNSLDSFESNIHNNKYSSSERDELKMMARKLRQAKRKLLLKAVETPVQPVESLRDLLLKISIAASPSDEVSCNSNSVDSFDVVAE